LAQERLAPVRDRLHEVLDFLRIAGHPVLVGLGRAPARLGLELLHEILIAEHDRIRHRVDERSH